MIVILPPQTTLGELRALAARHGIPFACVRLSKRGATWIATA